MTKHYIDTIMQKVSSLEEELKTGNTVLDTLKNSATSIANEISNKTVGLHTIVGAIQAFNATIQLLQSGAQMAGDAVDAGMHFAGDVIHAIESVTGQEAAIEPKE